MLGLSDHLLLDLEFSVFELLQLLKNHHAVLLNELGRWKLLLSELDLLI